MLHLMDKFVCNISDILILNSVYLKFTFSWASSILSGNSKREAQEWPLSFPKLFSMKGGFRSSELDGVSMHNSLGGSGF